MKATAFAYWLQGYFEINGGNPGLTEEQAKTVLKKAESVKAGPGDTEAKAKEFVERTKGVLFPVEQGLTVGNVSYLNAAADSLRVRLNYLFIHDIDPSYAGDQTQFNQIHNPDVPAGKPPRPHGDGMRC